MVKNDPLKLFGIILPAVAELMDEQNFSTDEAMAALRQFLENVEQPASVREAIGRLEGAENELELRAMLGHECLRALGINASR
ncbi:MAG TPA: hypothetical protein VFE47_07590 [Tepidisphaeraceae bacterium]|jgi:hypothetical protein|nr:hypothetical protein [Tepidisphaeraceae bacterium]